VVVVEEEGQRRRPGRRESISAGSPWRERDVARRVGHGWPAIPGENLRASNPTRPTAERLWRLGAPSRPRGGTLSGQGPGIVVVVSSRVVEPVAPVPNCPSQGSTCASLQCSCRSRSLEQPPGEWSRRSYRNGRVLLCLGRAHPPPQGPQSRRWRGRLAGRHPGRAGTVGLLSVQTPLSAVISARVGPQLPDGRV